MLWEQVAKSGKIHELSTNPDRKVPLVGKWPSRTHQLLKIELDGTSNDLIPIFVHVHLANVVEHRMRLGAIAWT